MPFGSFWWVFWVNGHQHNVTSGCFLSYKFLVAYIYHENMPFVMNITVGGKNPKQQPGILTISAG